MLPQSFQTLFKSNASRYNPVCPVSHTNKSQIHRLELNSPLFRLAQLISIFVSVWLTAAGIIHLVSANDNDK